MSDSLDHGAIAKADPSLSSFTQILGQRDPARMPDPTLLAGLAHYMANASDSLSDNPDPEENLYVPAGYTYLGQFVDHDLTLDTTSTLNLDDAKAKGDPANEPTNLRSPRFDLDCVYGNGPDDQPYLYAGVEDAARRVWKDATLVIGEYDLARAHNGPGVNGPGDPAAWAWSRAIIGDKRNDENSIVNQIQQLMIRFHNKVVDGLARSDDTLRGKALFRRARDTVRWTYQSILLQDFLPRIVEAGVLSNFLATRHYEVYPDDERRLRLNLPREFVAAVYRYGHSGVRQGYRLNGQPGPLEGPAGGGTLLNIFKNPDNDPAHSLIGFDPLPRAHVIDDWRRFFPAVGGLAAGERLFSDPSPDHAEVSDDGKRGGDGTVRLQYAYKLDTSLVDPLLNLPAKVATQADVQPPSLQNLPPRVDDPQPPKPWGPSLALLNLLRGNRYLLQPGQAYEALVSAIPLDKKYLCVRVATPTNDGKVYTFTRIKNLIGLDGQPLGEALEKETPLWFYILAEAQRPLVDFWIEAGRPLTERDLKGRDEHDHPVTVPDGADPATIEAALRATRCTGTQLGPVGGRIVTEVFYGLMESDPDSIFGPRKPPDWTPPFGAGAATMGRLIAWTLGT
jgi:hypothetical protein